MDENDIDYNEFDEIDPDPSVVEYVPQDSRYFKNAIVVDYNNSKMYDIPKKIHSAESDSDEYFVMMTATPSRLDKVSHNYYQNSRYWWVLANVNDITNPFDPTYNKSIRIPSLTDLLLDGVI